MNRYLLSLGACLLVTISADVARACEFAADGTIVVSDNWCAPSCVGSPCNWCNPGGVVYKAKCNNSYCDNMVLYCHVPQQLNGPTVVDPVGYSTAFTSDEDGMYSVKALCPAGFAMVGMYSNGAYSDNISSVCAGVYVRRPDGSYGQDGLTFVIRRATTPISEEAPNNSIQVTYWLNGASCTGAFCDNMYYYYTQVSW